MYLIPRIPSGDLRQVEEQLLCLPAEPIACCNWPEEFSYTPQVAFRAAHDGEHLYLRYEVREQVTRALQSVDGKPVCADSCVEIFLRPSLDDPRYYNFEFNAIGRLYAACRTGRRDPEYLDEEQRTRVERYASLGSEPFEECQGDNCWQLLVVISARALCNHKIADFSGRRMAMNLYKCGDGLTQPHYLSWAPIATPHPDFHRPEFFAEVVFES